MNFLPITMPKQISRIFAITVVLSVAIIVFSLVNFNVSKRLMLDYLKSEGVNIALSLEAAARSAGVENPAGLGPLMERYTDREHIAYMNVINREGSVVAGLDPAQIGQSIERTDIDQIIETQQVSVSRYNAIDSSVFEILVPVHLGRLDEGNHQVIELQEQLSQQSKQNYHILLLGIYAGFGEKTTQPAIVQLGLAVVLVSVLGLLGMSQFRTLQNYLTLEEQNKKNEKLAAIGTISAGVAHEIKNPLAAIKGMSQLLAEGTSEPEEESEYIRTIVKEANRLDTFLGQLLDYTRNRRLTLQAANLAVLIRETVNLVKEQAESSGVEFEINTSASEVHADSECLKQVLLNLVINGIQAMPGGGKLFISTGIIRDYVVIQVRDTGDGLLPGSEGKLFQPFYSTKNKGVGLGLALSKQIIEDHGGTLEASNHLDGGAEFTITLPGK